MPHDTLPQGCVTVWQWQKMWHNVSSVTQVADVAGRTTEQGRSLVFGCVRSCSGVFGSCNPQAIMLARLRRLILIREADTTEKPMANSQWRTNKANALVRSFGTISTLDRAGTFCAGL
jgi:hypothetical protein